MGPFSEHFRVIRYDVRGIGRSTLTERAAAYSNRQDLRDLLAWLGVERAHPVGASGGHDADGRRPGGWAAASSTFHGWYLCSKCGLRLPGYRESRRAPRAWRAAPPRVQAGEHESA